MGLRKYFDEPSEEALFGCIILENAIMDFVTGNITSEMFSPKGQVVFNAMKSLYEEFGCVDYLGLMKKVPHLGFEYIAQLTDSVPSSANYEFYMNSIQDTWRRRSLNLKLQELSENINDGNVLDKLNGLDSWVTDMMDSGVSRVHDMVSCTARFFDRLEARIKNNEPFTGYDTGWNNLNELLDGMRRGIVTILSGRTSMGKSAFSLQMAFNFAKQNIPVSIFSLEMSESSIYDRIMSVEAKVPLGRIKSGLVSQEADLSRLNDAANRISQVPLKIVDSVPKNERELIAQIRVHVKKYETKIVFVDHLGLVPHSDSSMKAWDQLGDIVIRLHELAKDLDISIIVLSQLGRDAEGKDPTLANLSGSSKIEANADCVLMVQRDRGNGTEEQIPAKIIVGKNRDGRTGTAKMLWLPHYTKFVEDTGSDEDSQTFEKVEKSSYKVGKIEKTEQKELF